MMWNSESKHSTTALREKKKKKKGWENPGLFFQAANVKYYYHKLNRKQQFLITQILKITLQACI